MLLSSTIQKIRENVLVQKLNFNSVKKNKTIYFVNIILLKFFQLKVVLLNYRLHKQKDYN